jgi:DNA-binding NarL/FixJ family response regulator
MFDAFDELGVDAATLAAELEAQRPMDWFEIDAEILFFRRFGLRDRAIAHRLRVSPATVRAHDKERVARWAAREVSAGTGSREDPYGNRQAA